LTKRFTKYFLFNFRKERVMKKGTKVLITLLTVVVLSASSVFAQCSVQKKCSAVPGQQGACCAAAPAAKTAACPFKAGGVDLTAAQQTRIKSIIAKARQDILATLKGAQKDIFKKMCSAGCMLGKKTCGTKCAQACKLSCPKPCCAEKKTCKANCTKPCCAKKKACGPNCDKSCCAVKVAVQTTCPIMKGNKINKKLFTVYKGKKVYFCCPGCEKKFNKNPKKYIKDLPQFKK
jgi:YHS domain-containing protein